MAKSTSILLPGLSRILRQLGERLRAARLRRNLTTEMVAERALLSLPTLRQIERGSSTVSLGGYAQVLLALNLEKDLILVAQDNDLGRRLQDLDLPQRVRPKGKKTIQTGAKS